MTDKRSQTIRFFMPQGEPRGIRTTVITTRIVQAVLVPRSELSQACSNTFDRSDWGSLQGMPE